MISAIIAASLALTANSLTFAPKEGSTGTDVAYIFFQGASSPAAGYAPVIEQIQ
jgi:hypothetical protein